MYICAILLYDICYYVVYEKKNERKMIINFSFHSEENFSFVVVFAAFWKFSSLVFSLMIGCADELKMRPKYESLSYFSVAFCSFHRSVHIASVLDTHGMLLLWYQFVMCTPASFYILIILQYNCDCGKTRCRNK